MSLRPTSAGLLLMLLKASCASTLEDCSFASHCFRALVASFTVVLGRAGETNWS